MSRVLRLIIHTKKDCLPKIDRLLDKIDKSPQSDTMAKVKLQVVALRDRFVESHANANAIEQYGLNVTMPPSDEALVASLFEEEWTDRHDTDFWLDAEFFNVEDDGDLPPLEPIDPPGN
jgi:hypothetical protein